MGFCDSGILGRAVVYGIGGTGIVGRAFVQGFGENRNMPLTVRIAVLASAAKHRACLFERAVTRQLGVGMCEGGRADNPLNCDVGKCIKA